VAFTVSVNEAVVLPDELEAVTVYKVGPEAACGIPLMMPVASIPIVPGGGMELMLRPSGSVGEMLYAGTFVPPEM
jgi:hypothetical protein